MCTICQNTYQAYLRHLKMVSEIDGLPMQEPIFKTWEQLRDDDTQLASQCIDYHGEQEAITLLQPTVRIFYFGNEVVLVESVQSASQKARAALRKKSAPKQLRILCEAVGRKKIFEHETTGDDGIKRKFFLARSKVLVSELNVVIENHDLRDRRLLSLRRKLQNSRLTKNWEMYLSMIYLLTKHVANPEPAGGEHITSTKGTWNEYEPTMEVYY